LKVTEKQKGIQFHWSTCKVGTSESWVQENENGSKRKGGRGWGLKIGGEISKRLKSLTGRNWTEGR